MISDPFTLAATLCGTLIAGVITGAIVAGLAARGQRLDDDERAGQGFRDLLALAQECADPVHLARLMRGAAQIWDHTRPDGLTLNITSQAASPQATPGYVHRIIDAYASGDPVDFGGCSVPPDVRGRLRAILAGASEPTTALAVWPTNPISVPSAVRVDDLKPLPSGGRP